MRFNNTITVQSIGELQTVHVAQLREGSVAWVETVQEFYVLYKFATDTPDNIVFVAPLTGSPIAGNAGALWIRQASPSSSAAIFQPEWHINPQTGNDQNDGATALTALATFAEFRRRIGPGPISVAMTVWFDENLEESVTMDVVTLNESTTLTFRGHRTAIRTSTFSAVQVWDPAANQEGTVSDATLPVSWVASGLVGRMLVRTNAPEAIGWVALETVAKTARFSPLIDLDTFAIVDPVMGDGYQVCNLTEIREPVDIRQFGMGAFVMMDLYVRTPGFTALQISGQMASVQGCKFTGFDIAMSCENVSLAGCFVDGALDVINGSCFVDAGFVAGAAHAAAFGQSFLIIQQASLLQDNSPLQSSSGGLVTVEGGADGWCAIFNCETAVACLSNSQMRLTGQVFGQNISTVGVLVESGACVVYVALPDLTAPADDTIIAGVATAFGALPHTEPDFMAGIVVLA